jgi:hypothetical protein
MELNFSGCYYTWNNKSEGSGFVARKLDTVLVNEEWVCKFGRTCIDFPSSGVSDHSFAIISVSTMVSFGLKRFKFFTYWLDNKEYMDWLNTSWNQECRGVPMYRLYMKLKAFKAIMKGKNSSCYGDIRSKVLHAQECLDIAQRDALNSHGSADSLSKEREYLHAYVSTSRAEEAFLKQKARNQWHKLGDQNSGYFHRVVKGRHAKNSITHVCDENVTHVEGITEIKSVVENF